jgi:hypothetical protein
MKLLVTASSLALLIGSGCSAAGSGSSNDDGSGNKGSGASGSMGGQPNLTSANGGDLNLAATSGTGATGPVGQPQDCDEAAKGHTYVGCDFWPTIVANPVWPEFEPAVVVANGNDASVTVTVDGPASFHQEVTIAPKGLETVMLKWVMDLKGKEFSRGNTSGSRDVVSSRVDKGAYHMTSTLPVTAWQFNPLKYTLPEGGCTHVATACKSATNDASLLIPSTAMTETYRVFGYSSKNEGLDWGTVPGGIAITATKDGTTVDVKLGPKCGVEIFPTTMLGTCVSADKGGAVKEGMPGDVQTYTMNAGDVVQLVGAWSASPQVKNADLSGTIVQSNKNYPVQVVSFNAISQLPDANVGNADHMEETVLPAEVIGNKYIVVPPTTPLGTSVGHVVRIYGNKDGTVLTYPEGKPEGAPDMINEGDVFQIPPLPVGTPAESCLTAANKCMTNMPFVVEGTEAFAVASFMVGGGVQIGVPQDQNAPGDPSFSMEVTPQQFRREYSFLAPADYDTNFADVLVPEGADVVLDGTAVAQMPVAIGNSKWGSLRLKLDNANGGVHTLTTTHMSGLGLQVMGFGSATSYYYPGGLNLERITDPPVIVK